MTSKRKKISKIHLGKPPGTLTINPSASQPLLRLFAFNADNYTEQAISNLAEIDAYRKDNQIIWLNVDGLGDADTIKHIAKMFNLHRLAVEDITNIHQRAKFEDYPQHLFLVVRMASWNQSIDTEQVSIFFGQGFVITFQEHPGDCLEPVRERIRNSKGRIRTASADYLAYAILDAIVDAYYPILEEFGDRIEQVENSISDNCSEKDIETIRQIKRDLLHFRRAVWPLRDAVNTFFREESPLITADTHIYIRDCYDHTIQIIDLLESYRELSSGLMDIYMSSMGNRMNEVMKVLTIFASIFIPLTFIAGIYGMNFNTELSKWNMPELNWKFGYAYAWGLMLIVTGCMLVFFYRKGWILKRKTNLQ